MTNSSYIPPSRYIPSPNESVFGLYELWATHYFNATVNGSEARPIWIASFLVGSLVALCGNAVIVLALFRDAVRLDNVTTTLIKHIVVADLGHIFLIVLPVLVTVTADRWLLGRELCHVQAYTRLVFMNASSLLVCGLNCSKLAYLQYPLRARVWPAARGHMWGAAMWIIAFVPLVWLVIVAILQDASDLVFFSNQSMSCGYNLGALGEQTAITIIILSMAPGPIVIGTTIYLIKIAWSRNCVTNRYARKVKWEGILTVILIAVVYCLSNIPYYTWICSATFFIETMRSQSPSFQSFWITDLYSLVTFLTFLNNITNAPIYYISIISFKEFVDKTIFRMRKMPPKSLSNFGTLHTLTGSHRRPGSNTVRKGQTYPSTRSRRRQPHTSECDVLFSNSTVSEISNDNLRVGLSHGLPETTILSNDHKGHGLGHQHISEISNGSVRRGDSNGSVRGGKPVIGQTVSVPLNNVSEDSSGIVGHSSGIVGHSSGIVGGRLPSSGEIETP